MLNVVDALSRRDFLQWLGFFAGSAALPSVFRSGQEIYLPLIRNGTIPLPGGDFIGAAIGQYAAAWGFAAADVLPRIQVSDAEPFVGYDSLTGVPLLVAEKDSDGVSWSWKKMTLRKAADLAKVALGTSVAGSDANWDTAEYQAAAGDAFGILKAVGFSPEAMLQWPDMPGRLAGIAGKYDMALYTGALFSHYDQDPELLNLENPSVSQVTDSMKRRIRDVYSYISAAGSGGYVDVLAEAMWWWQDNGGWEESVYYKTFREDLITEAYVLAHQAAIERSLRPGKDLVLLYNDYGIEIPGPKSDFVFEHLARSKNGIAARLGIAPEAVALGVGIEFHVFTDPGQTAVGGTYSADLSTERIVENLRRFSELGPVYITELQINNSQDVQEIQDLLLLVIHAALQSRVVSGITLYETLRFENLWHAINCGIFTSRFQPTRFYYELQSLFCRFAAPSR